MYLYVCLIQNHHTSFGMLPSLKPDGWLHSPWTPSPLAALVARALVIRVAIASTFSLALALGSLLLQVPDQVLVALQGRINILDRLLQHRFLLLHT